MSDPNAVEPAALEFVRRHHNGVLATTRSDGRPQLSPVLVGVDDEGRLEVSTREASVKVRNVRRDPFVSVCVLGDGFFDDWKQLEGRAEILPLPAAMEPLVAYYRRIAGEHADWAEYRAAMQEQRRVLLKITVTRTGPTVSG